MERQRAEVGTAVGDGSYASRYQTIGLADVGCDRVEHVVDADVLHHVEMAEEVAKDARDRGDVREDGIVETI